MTTSHYKIHTTEGDELIIHPQYTDTSTDLLLYGMGTLQWGRGVDQNLYRLLETFACKQLPKADPNDSPFPETTAELGEGNGINNPRTGQLWYNLDTEKVYVFDGTKWLQVGGTTAVAPPPVDPPGGSPVDPVDPPKVPTYSPGDLWFPDDGTGGICEQKQLLIYDPDHCEEPLPGVPEGWVSVAQNYIPRCGTSTICAELDFSAGVTPCGDTLDGKGDNLADGGCSDSGQGKIIGAELEDCIIIDDDTSPNFPHSPVAKKDIYKYIYPGGTRMMFAQSCAPIGWTTDTSAGTSGVHDRMMRVVTSGGGGLGGSESPIIMTKVISHSHGVSISSGGSHGHSASTSSSGHSHGTITSNTTGNHSHPTWTKGTEGSHNHLVSVSNGGSHGHSGSSSSSGNHWHSTTTVYFAGSGGAADGYPAASATSSTTGSAGSHSHTISISSGGSHGHSASSGNAGSHGHTLSMGDAGNHSHSVTIGNGGSHSHTVTISSGGSHSHSGTATATGSASWSPKYYNVIIAQKVQEDPDVFDKKVGGTENNLPDEGNCDSP